jgi:hypothetical protein
LTHPSVSFVRVAPVEGTSRAAREPFNWGLIGIVGIALEAWIMLVLVGIIWLDPL